MKIIETSIPGLLIIEPKVHVDNRGFLMEAYNLDCFKSNGLEFDFVQENQSCSMYGVVRGLHYQDEPYSQAKLASVLSGRVFDVAVDIRRGSPTYGKWCGVELSAENHIQFLIPRGFAHGLSVLEDNTIFCYKCDNYYHLEVEGGILYSDSDLNIDWHIPVDKIIVSPKDKMRSCLKDVTSHFVYSGV